MKNWRVKLRNLKPRRKGKLIQKNLTEDNKKYILIYIDDEYKRTQTLGSYTSLEEAKTNLNKNIKDLKEGVFYIISDDNRVIYSEKEEK